MRQVTIGKKFLSIVIISIIVISTLCIASIYRTYQLNQNLIMLKMETEASKLEKTLDYMFDYAKYILTHINSQIHQKGSDTEYIGKLVKSFKNTDKEAKSLFAASLFSWVDKDLYLRASSNIGELSTPIDLPDKDFWRKTIEHPNTLQLSSPIGGVTSGQWIVTSAIGLTNTKDEFIGAMAVGINIGTLKERLEENLTEPGMSFSVIDIRNREIITESNNIKKMKHCIIAENIDFVDFVNKDKGIIFDNSFFSKNIAKTYYITSNYPYAIIINYDNSTINKKIIATILPQIFIFAAIFMILILLLYLIHSIIISPLVKLSDFTNDIMLNNHSSNNLKDLSSLYEFNNLAEHLRHISYYIFREKTLNRELSIAKLEVEKAHKELLFINEKLEEKVLERTKELEKAVAIKSNFLSNMSHEVRTPIHGVINFAKFLIKQWSILSEEKKFDIANKIYKNSGRLLSLINNLLDLSKLDSKNMVFSMLDHDLSKLAEDTIEEVSSLFEGQVQTSEIRFFNLASSSICKCDNERITQVMRNLLANAIKFGKSNPIIVELSNSEILSNDKNVEAIKFTVIDQGVGIPIGEEYDIFEKFIESSRTRTKAGGTGLGLSISKEIIDYHNGKIWVVNNVEGGTSFSFVIPINSNQ